MSNNGFIKIVSFYTNDGIAYGTNLSSFNKENVSLYNDSVIEVSDELSDYPKQIWLGNIGSDGHISEQDKNPFTSEYMLSCDKDGKPYRFLKRIDVQIDNKSVCERSKDIQIVCFETTDIYDTTNHEIYLIDTYDGVIHGIKMTDFGDMDILNNYSWCCYISEHVLMYKDYCDIVEWDQQFDDMGLSGMCYHYCLYNTKTHKKIGFIAPNIAIRYTNEDKRIYNEMEPLTIDLLSVDRYGSIRIKGARLWLDDLSLNDKNNKNLSYVLDKE